MYGFFVRRDEKKVVFIAREGPMAEVGWCQFIIIERYCVTEYEVVVSFITTKKTALLYLDSVVS